MSKNHFLFFSAFLKLKYDQKLYLYFVQNYCSINLHRLTEFQIIANIYYANIQIKSIKIKYHYFFTVYIIIIL